MPCCSCVHKLAFKLIEHHRARLDLILALELAEKGVARYESRPDKIDPPKPNVIYKAFDEQEENLPFDPDYALACIATGSCTCNAVGTDCSEIPCENVGTCSCSCPAPSKPHSHYVNNTCTSYQTGCPCHTGKYGDTCLAGTCVCNCSSYCWYACDSGYVFDGSDCIPVAVVAGVLGDGITFVGT